METIAKKYFPRKTDPEFTMDYGKLPPQVKELEEAVLGAIMIEKEAIHEVITIVRTPDFFYVDAHQRIFEAIKALYDANNPIDLLTVTEQLKKTGNLDASGGPFYVAQLTNKIGSAGNIEFHSRLIAEKYLARQIILTGSKMIKGAYEDEADVFDLLGSVSLQIDRLNNDLGYSDSESVPDYLCELQADADNAINDPNFSVGLKTGNTEVDRISGGFKKGNLIIVAARPAMGKTAFSIDIARRQAKRNVPIAIFSYEMTAKELLQRMIAAESQLGLGKILNPKLLSQTEYDLFNSTIQYLKSLPLHICDKIVSIQEVKSRARILKRKFNIEEIILDYIQLVPGDGSHKNREQEVSTFSRQLKLLAKELELPIIALSQLSRECEKRADKKPILSDLRESGAIEQDADAVIFLHRASYYTDNNDMTTEVIWAKHRNGVVGSIDQVFDGEHQCFWDNDSRSQDAKLEQEMRYNSNKTMRQGNDYSAPATSDDQPF